MLSFFLGKKEENNFKTLWEKINKNINSKNEISELNENFNLFYKLIKEKIKFTNKSQNQNINDESEKLSFLQTNNILAEISNFASIYPESRPITLEYLSSFLNSLKYQKFLFKDNEKLFISLKNLVMILNKELEQKAYKFILKNGFAYLLNSITRIILNYPSSISYFKIKIKKIYSNEEYNDFIIFSSLLKLLEIDQTINNYLYKKYIRRSLIVSLSFDDIDKNNYLLNESFVVEILINKLCNYYQMLPNYFDIDKNTKSLEPSVNINSTKNSFISIYIDFKDYTIFLNKIINCFIDDKIKEKMQNYFFNKYLIENVMPNLLNHNIKILRTHLQYLITILKLSKNNTIIINTISYFLLGICDNNMDNEMENYIENNSNNDENNTSESINNSLYEDPIYMNFILSNYKPDKIKSLLLSNLNKKTECINIIIYELFNIFFQKKPYLMIKSFVKPYTDYVINKSNNKTKFILGNNTSYPMSNQLLMLLNKINSYKTNYSMENNIECSLFKNLCFYINYDIDFYEYYLNNKKKEDLLLNQSSQSINNNNNEMSSFRINEDSFSEQSSKTDTLEDNIIKGLNPNFIKNLLTPKDKKINNQKEKSKYKKEKYMYNENDIIVKDIFANEKYIKDNINENDNEENISINYKLNFDIENKYFSNKNKKNVPSEKNINDCNNILFMKNIHHKLINFESNTNIENLLLCHLIVTIISIPNFTFDSDLLRCNLVLLDNDEKSKYSFLTIFKYHSLEIIKKLKIIENEIKLKLVLKDFNLNNSLNPKNEFKIGLDFNGFDLTEKLNEKDEDKSKIVNWVIFYEFIKEIISCISHKYKFEELIENLFVFYSEQLDEFYNDNMNEEEEEEENENEERGDELENENNYQSNKLQNMYSNANSNNIEFEDNL